MKAEIISTGTELLLGKTLNTSAFYLTGQLSGMGIEVSYHHTVGDNKERLLLAVNQALDRSQLVILTGGLGPTVDDLTKEVIALVLGLTMDFDRQSMANIEKFYAHESDLPPGSENQAFFPKGAKILPNDVGTAPGALMEKDGKYCIILPGPPSEMEPMFERYVIPELNTIMNKVKERMYVRVLKVFGLGESELEQELPDLMQRATPFLTLLDKHTYMDVRITMRSSDQDLAWQKINETESLIRQRLGSKVFGVDEETHSQVVGNLLRSYKLTLATAESCTGGLLGEKITAEAGSSDYYLGGVISYANSAKEKLLSVSKSSLLKEGAVSAEVAGQMAEGVRRTLAADLALATTGIAGPGGGSAQKPVGLVYIGLAHPQGIKVEKFQFAGHRDSIRNMTVETALNMLREFLLIYN
ncbi:MAG: competence/damage-inducible protein A [Peptococcaceae bacterium]|jgi:nicotinamide-nucleotide amidase|nr:competence/damage-inducible protein A [Peptococcaceae bacterium]